MVREGGGGHDNGFHKHTANIFIITFSIPSRTHLVERTRKTESYLSDIFQISTPSHSSLIQPKLMIPPSGAG